MTLNPQPLVLHLNTKRDALVESYRRETELYAAGFVNRAPDCPNGPPRKVVVFSRQLGRTERVEIPSICDCNNTRFQMGFGTRHCKTIGVCPVQKELFPNGTYS